MKSIRLEDSYLNMVRKARKEVSDLLSKYSDCIVLFMSSYSGDVDYVTIRLDLGMPMVDIYDSRRDGIYDNEELFKLFLLAKVQLEIKEFSNEINSIKLN